jgi:hypothetical protein
MTYRSRGGAEPAATAAGDGRCNSAIFAHISAAGPVRYGQFPFAIGVLAESDPFLPISMASEVGWTEGGLEVLCEGRRSWTPTCPVGE